MSRELGKVTPAMMTELDSVAGDPVAVGKLLQKMKWRKAPDHFNFPAAVTKARKEGNDKLADELKLMATRDCLFRFFEAQAGVELPGIPVRRKSPGKAPGSSQYR